MENPRSSLIIPKRRTTPCSLIGGIGQPRIVNLWTYFVPFCWQSWEGFRAISYLTISASRTAIVQGYSVHHNPGTAMIGASGGVGRASRFFRGFGLPVPFRSHRESFIPRQPPPPPGCGL